MVSPFERDSRLQTHLTIAFYGYQRVMFIVSRDKAETGKRTVACVRFGSFSKQVTIYLV